MSSAEKDSPPSASLTPIREGDETSKMSDSSNGNPIGSGSDDEVASAKAGAAEASASAAASSEISASAPTSTSGASSATSSVGEGEETPPSASEHGSGGSAADVVSGGTAATPSEKTGVAEADGAEKVDAGDDVHDEESKTADDSSSAAAGTGVPAKAPSAAKATAATKSPAPAPIPAWISPIFGPAIGPLKGEFPCRHREPPRSYAYQGRFYVATRACCFHSSNFFGYEQCRIVLPLGGIAGVAKVQEDGVNIMDDKGKDMLFMGFKERDKAFDLVKGLWEREIRDKNKGKGREGGEKTKTEGAEESRGDGGADNKGKVQEEPLKKSVVISDCPFTGHGEGASKMSVHQSMQLRRSMSAPGSAKLLEAAAAEAAAEAEAKGEGSSHSQPPPQPSADDEEKEATEQDIATAMSVLQMHSDLRSSRRILISEMEKGGLLSSEGKAAADKYGKMVPEDMRSAWIAARDSKEPGFANVVVQAATLPCTLDEFFSLFLSNESRHSVSDYQRDVLGDTELETSPWSLSEEDAFSLTRTVKYVHPVNAPMAPPSAAATKEQCYRRFGDHGMVLETQTVVNDVPMADCFYVDDRMLVEPTPDGGVALTAAFEVRFVKRTMFRKVINGTSGSEVTKGLKGYEAYMRKALEEREAAKVQAEGAEEKGEPEEGEEEAAEVGVEVKERVVTAPPAAEEQKEKPGVLPAVTAPSAAPAPPAFMPTSKTEKYLLIIAGLVGGIVFLQCVSIWQSRSLGLSIDRLNESQEMLTYLMKEVLTVKGSEAQTCGADV